MLCRSCSRYEQSWYVYKSVLIENGMKKTDLARDYKRKLKEVIEDYGPNAVFVKSKHKNKPEQIITKDI